MSDFGENEYQIGDTLEHQTPIANTGPSVSVHVDNMQVSTTQENEEAESGSGEQSNNRPRTNRPVDSAKLSPDSEAELRTNHPTGPRRMHTAPVSRPEVERQQSLQPIPADQVQGVPTKQEDRLIDIQSSCVCGLLQCRSMDGMWLRGGSLQVMDTDEQIAVESAARFGDCCRIYNLLAFIVVTNKRIILKQLTKVGPFNFQSREESYHFSDLQHVAVERGLGTQRTRNRASIIAVISLIAALGFTVDQVPLLFAILLLIAGIPYAIYNIVIFILLYNVNFLVIDVARSSPVGSWNSALAYLTGGRRYQNIRVALHIDSCFSVMNELLKKHPSLPLPGDNV